MVVDSAGIPTYTFAKSDNISLYFSRPWCYAGFQMFDVTFFITRTHSGYLLGCAYASVLSKIPKIRQCTWCVFPRGDSSPLR